MITTHEITLDQPQLFCLLVRTNFQRRTLLLFGAAGVLTLVNIVLAPQHTWFYVMLGALLLFPLLTLWQARWLSRNEMNKQAYIPRYYTITDTEMTAHLKGGAEETFSILHLQRLVRTREYYLLYTGRTEFIYLPHSAFPSIQEREEFDRMIAGRVRKTKR